MTLTERDAQIRRLIDELLSQAGSANQERAQNLAAELGNAITQQSAALWQHGLDRGMQIGEFAAGEAQGRAQANDALRRLLEAWPAEYLH